MIEPFPILGATDPVKLWTFIIVGASFALYISIGWWAQARSTSEFYVAGGQVSPLANGMAHATLSMALGSNPIALASGVLGAHSATARLTPLCSCLLGRIQSH